MIVRLRLYRIASERPEQWLRTEAACRVPTRCRRYPWRDAPHVATRRADETGGGGRKELGTLWRMALMFLAAAVSTRGASPAALRVHNILQSVARSAARAAEPRAQSVVSA